MPKNKWTTSSSIGAVIMTFACSANAQRKDCTELVREIEAKIRANGVSAFTVTALPKEAAVDGKVVGSCNGGTMKVVYRRG